MKSPHTPTGPMDRWPLDALMDHIVHTHHAYVRKSLAKLRSLLDEVVATHGSHDDRLRTLAKLFSGIEFQLLNHLGKEESILFPTVREILRGTISSEAPHRVVGPLMCMELEHEEAGDAIATARQITDGFTPPPGASKSHRALLAGLEALEADLKEHMHKENDILFPGIRAYADEVANTAS